MLVPLHYVTYEMKFGSCYYIDRENKVFELLSNKYGLSHLNSIYNYNALVIYYIIIPKIKKYELPK